MSDQPNCGWSWALVSLDGSEKTTMQWCIEVALGHAADWLRWLALIDNFAGDGLVLAVVPLCLLAVLLPIAVYRVWCLEDE